MGGGAGTSNSITGSAVTYATGGNVRASGQATGAANTGDGGSSNTQSGGGAAGGSGIVVLSYSDSFLDFTTISGLTYTKTSSGGKTIYTFTAGNGTVTV
jgi:hypothetical protein